MTQRRAWALVALACAALALTPFAGFAAALVAVSALAALCALAALQARDSVREQRLAAMESAVRDAKDDSKRVAEMWRVYQQGA